MSIPNFSPFTCTIVMNIQQIFYEVYLLGGFIEHPTNCYKPIWSKGLGTSSRYLRTKISYTLGSIQTTQGTNTETIPSV